MVIPAEVINDSFSQCIGRVASEESVRVAFEIGFSNGAGSTAALVTAMSSKPVEDLQCLEISRPRFRQLEARYWDLPWVHCHNMPSVDPSLMAHEPVIDFFFAANPDSPLSRTKLKEVRRWLKQDRKHIATHSCGGYGVAHVLELIGDSHFDLVLIDGSEFSGVAEFEQVFGARFSLLDDVLTFKNRSNCIRTLEGDAYQLLEEDFSCRNGFAAFRLVDA